MQVKAGLRCAVVQLALDFGGNTADADGDGDITKLQITALPTMGSVWAQPSWDIAHGDGGGGSGGGSGGGTAQLGYSTR